MRLQQFDIQFQHISGKKNVVADAMHRFRNLGLYQDNGNDDLATMDDDMVENVAEEVHNIKWVLNSAGYNRQKLNLDVLREKQWQDTSCIKKVKALRAKQDDTFTQDNNSILQKMVQLRYTIEPTMVVPRKLTSLIIVELHNDKGHQGVQSHSEHDKALLLVGRHVQRHTPTHQQLPVMYSVST